MIHTPVTPRWALVALLLPACDLTTDFGDVAEAETSNAEARTGTPTDADLTPESQLSCENDDPVDFANMFVMSPQHYYELELAEAAVWDLEELIDPLDVPEGTVVLVFSSEANASCDDIFFSNLSLQDPDFPVENVSSTLFSLTLPPEMQSPGLYTIDDRFNGHVPQFDFEHRFMNDIGYVSGIGYAGSGVGGQIEITSIDDAHIEGVVCVVDDGFGIFEEAQADPSTSFRATFCED